MNPNDRDPSPGGEQPVVPLGQGERLFRNYCRTPEKFWPEGAQRQARKVVQRVRLVSGNAAAARLDVPLGLFDMARERVGSRRRTVHIANIGSSGSHWLEQMLVKGVGMLGAGEVYVPPQLRKRLDTLSVEERAVFLDALLLLHAGGIDGDRSASVVHSLHSANPEVFLESDPDTLRVLLLRNPIDVCLSRVFRKDEYRKDVAADADDMLYLRQNISKVKEFLTTASGQVFDIALRYEGLLRDPAPALGAIASMTSSPFDDQRARRGIEDQSAERLTQGGQARATNLYVGSRSVPDEARETAIRELGPLCEYFGYAVADA